MLSNVTAAEKEYIDAHGVEAVVQSIVASAAACGAEDFRDHARLHLAESIRNELQFKAIIFDLDGCITKTAAVHSRAWKAMFDAFLRDEATNAPLPEFTPQDYLKYVDGRPRYEGVATFLQSRSLSLPAGSPEDPPGLAPPTCCSLGNRKNDFFLEVLHKEGVEEYPSSVRIIRAARALGIRLGVASSSKNAAVVLEQAGLTSLIEERVDGVVSAATGLKGKPAGDIFVTCCKKLGCSPHEAIVIEDATSGVEAGRNGKVWLFCAKQETRKKC